MHYVNKAHVPTFGVVVFVPGVNAQAPSEPPPKQASLAVYDEQVDWAMQLTPLETHLTPVMALAHEALDVNNESEHYLSLQTDEVVAGVVFVAAVVVVAQKHTPSVP